MVTRSRQFGASFLFFFTINTLYLRSLGAVVAERRRRHDQICNKRGLRRILLKSFLLCVHSNGVFYHPAHANFFVFLHETSNVPEHYKTRTGIRAAGAPEQQNTRNETLTAHQPPPRDYLRNDKTKKKKRNGHNHTPRKVLWVRFYFESVGFESD